MYTHSAVGCSRLLAKFKETWNLEIFGRPMQKVGQMGYVRVEAEKAERRSEGRGLRVVCFEKKAETENFHFLSRDHPSRAK
jgi:hypothetical protein